MSVSKIISGFDRFGITRLKAARACKKTTMTKSDCFRVCLDDVKIAGLPDDILKYYDLDKVNRFLDEKGSPSKILGTKDIEYNYLLKPTLSYVLKCAHLDKDTNKTLNDANAQTSLFDCGFKLAHSPPYSERKYTHIDEASFYYLYTSLIDIINKILCSPTNESLYYVLRKCSNNINNCFLEENKSKSLILEIISHYITIGAVIMENAEQTKDLELVLKNCRLVDEQKLTNAEKIDHDIGFSFSPCGFLIPYHVGVLNLLSELNAVNVTTPLSGASSGAISIISSALLNDFPFLMSLIEELSSEALINGIRHRLDFLITTFFNKYLKNNCHELINSRIGPIVVAYSRLGFCRFKPVLVSEFSSPSDLRDCLRASCYIPMLSSKDLVYYNNKPGFDGQLSLSKNLGCAKTIAKRTISTNPYPFYLRTFSKRLLDNEYITPSLFRRDKYLVHYIRFKGLLYHLWLRKIELDDTQQWIKEVELCISLYKVIMNKGRKEDCNSWHALHKLWSSDMLDLFCLVAESEGSLNVEKNSARRIKYNICKVDITKKFAVTRFKISRAKFNVSPITTIDWLEAQNSSNTSHATLSDPLVTMKIRSLQNLLHTITPPMSLRYHYTISKELLRTNTKLHKLMNMSLYSTDKSNLRFLYDLGKTDAFRWIIHDYIAFENWLYLKIKHLEDGNVINKTYSDTSDSCSINHRQTELVHKTLSMVSRRVLDNAKSPKTCVKTKETEFFRIQNNAVKSVILFDCVDSRYTHILGHTHFWVYDTY